ncbi:hypothetical protein PDIDSM_681 [Penicillium digitatum]|nr:hypothetical protein PDIDSM_681 [Penicillium digitatum]
METVSQTVTSASTLLNTWTRILSQTEHNQRLILNPNWQGATQDVVDIENQAIQRQQAAERREQALQQQREAAARKAEEIEKRRAQVTRGTRGPRNYEGYTSPKVSSPPVDASRSDNDWKITPSDSPDGIHSPFQLERALSPPQPDGHRISPILLTDPDLPPFLAATWQHWLRTGHRGWSCELRGFVPIRMDIEAALAYLLLPPAGGVFLLLAEHKSDYVRFHAWQSSMLFATMFIIHLLFCWSSFLSWTLFIVDIALIGFLSMHAYQDVDTLDHFEVPLFGHLANSFVDDE